MKKTRLRILSFLAVAALAVFARQFYPKSDHPPEQRVEYAGGNEDTQIRLIYNIRKSEQYIIVNDETFPVVRVDHFRDWGSAEYTTEAGVLFRKRDMIKWEATRSWNGQPLKATKNTFN